MLLSDGDIEYLLKHEPDQLSFQPDISHSQIQPASIDLRLGRELKIQVKTGVPVGRHPGGQPAYQDAVIPGEGFCLYPDQFYLGHTEEHIFLGDQIAAKVEGKSSWGRLGLEMHSTAGWIDPGFDGQITFEMKVVGVDPVLVRAGQAIGQICLFRMRAPAVRPYGHEARNSRYKGQRGPTVAR